jgi:hypothetical protein
MTSTVMGTLPFENQAPVTYGVTYHNLDGNRNVQGSINIENIERLDIPLEGQLAWVVAAPFQGSSLWLVALADGSLQAFTIINKEVLPLPHGLPGLPAGMPPVLRVTGDNYDVLTNPVVEASPTSHPVPLQPGDENLLFMESQGDLVYWDQGELSRMALDGLPDGRILVDEKGRFLLLASPTQRYEHGVLGDKVEAGEVLLVDIRANLVLTRIPVEPPAVIEGLYPIWADLDGDGNREIIVVQSDPQVGAWIAVYSESGVLITSGTPIGQGYRWRHPLAVAPFGPRGELELAVVRTPHIGGVLEFYRLDGGDLEIVAKRSGFSTHTIGSRNLDNALAIDFDADGQMELLLPDISQEVLKVVKRIDSGLEVIWEMPLEAQMGTNLAAVTLDNGSIHFGVGITSGVLRLWIAE